MNRSEPLLSSGSFIPSGEPSFMIRISMPVAANVNPMAMRCLCHLARFLAAFPKYLMYRMLRHVSRMIPTLLDRTLPKVLSTRSVSKDSRAKRVTMRSLMTNTPLAASRIQRMYELERAFSSERFWRKIPAIAMMLHPRTSVVAAVESAWIRSGEVNIY